MTLISFLFFTGLVALLTYLITRKDDHESSSGYFLAGRSLTLSADCRVPVADQPLHRTDGRAERLGVHGRVLRHGVGGGRRRGTGGDGPLLPASLPEERRGNRAPVPGDPVRPPDAGHHQPDLPGGLCRHPPAHHPLHRCHRHDRNSGCEGHSRNQFGHGGAVADRLGRGDRRLHLCAVRGTAHRCRVRHPQRGSGY